MQHHRVNKVDTGIITNNAAKNVVWRRGRNVRFKSGSVYKTKGKALLATTPGALSIRSLFTFTGHDDVLRTIVACDNKIFAYQSLFTVIQDITPSPVPTGTSYNWQATLIGGMFVLTNGINGVWKWPDYLAALQPLANAPARAKLLSTIDNRILFGNILEGVINHQSRLHWTEIAKPESRTVDRKMRADNQDLIDPDGNSDAIEIPLAVSSRPDRKIIYTKNNIWMMVKTDSGQYALRIAVPGIRLAAAKAKVSVKGVDYFMGSDDFYAMGGGAPVPIGFDIRPVFETFNQAAIHTAFAFYQPETREIFFCVATGFNTEPDTAFVYNLELKAWTILDCNYLCANSAWQNSGAGSGFGEGGFGEGPFGGADPGSTQYPIVGNASGQILRLDYTDNDNGEAFTGYVEAGDTDLGNALAEKQTHAVIPFLSETTSTEPLMVQIGVRASLSSPADYSIPKPFSPGISKHAKAVKTGSWLTARFYTDQLNSPWELTGYEIIYDALSKR